MKIERVWAMPNKWTFKIPHIEKLILEELEDCVRGESFDPFAGTNTLATHLNDINPIHETEYNMDALEFLRSLESQKFAFGFFDPPFSPRQFKECYDMLKLKAPTEVFNAGYLSKCRIEIGRLIRSDGIVVTCGWNTNGIGKKRGFEIERILVVAHGSNHNDTLVTVERKIQTTLND